MKKKIIAKLKSEETRVVLRLGNRRSDCIEILNQVIKPFTISASRISTLSAAYSMDRVLIPELCLKREVRKQLTDVFCQMLLPVFNGQTIVLKPAQPAARVLNMGGGIGVENEAVSQVFEVNGNRAEVTSIDYNWACQDHYLNAMRGIRRLLGLITPDEYRSLGELITGRGVFFKADARYELDFIEEGSFDAGVWFHPDTGGLAFKNKSTIQAMVAQYALALKDGARLGIWTYHQHEADQVLGLLQDAGFRVLQAPCKNPDLIDGFVNTYRKTHARHGDKWGLSHYGWRLSVEKTDAIESGIQRMKLKPNPSMIERVQHMDQATRHEILLIAFFIVLAITIYGQPETSRT